YDPKKPIPRLGGTFRQVFHVAFADGSVSALPRTLAPAALRALITPAGGEVVAGPGGREAGGPRGGGPGGGGLGGGGPRGGGRRDSPGGAGPPQPAQHDTPGGSGRAPRAPRRVEDRAGGPPLGGGGGPPAENRPDGGGDPEGERPAGEGPARVPRRG